MSVIKREPVDEFDSDEDEDECNDEYANVGALTTLRRKNFETNRITKYLDEDFAQPQKSTSETLFEIVKASNGFMWKVPDEVYECKIVDVKKEKKIFGMKTCNMFQIVPSFSNIQVGRTAGHFRWLQERLSSKFVTITIPPLPTKQFVEKSLRPNENLKDCRIRLLQSWIRRISLHPILSQAEEFKKVFLSCTDDKTFNKTMKTATKDQSNDVHFFNLVKAPSCNGLKSDEMMEKFSQMISNLDLACFKFDIATENFVKLHKTTVARECERLAASFKGLASAFATNKTEDNKQVTKAYEETGDLYNIIALSFKTDVDKSTWTILDTVREYKKMLSCFPDVALVDKTAKEKNQEKTFDDEIKKAEKKTEIVTCAMKAEMNHFYIHQNKDFKDALVSFVEAQIRFHLETANKFETILKSAGFK